MTWPSWVSPSRNLNLRETEPLEPIMAALVDVLVPTYARPAALAVTLEGLVSQTFRDFRLVISDQTPDFDAADVGEVKAVLNVLEAHGHNWEIHKHLPPRGMAEQRQFLLDKAQGAYALFLDDDLILEPYLIQVLVEAIQSEGCGFVGSAVIGLSYANDVRPEEQHIEFWDGPVQPEAVRPNTPEWQRHRLHNAANIYHVARRLNLDPLEPRRYKVAWVGGCVLYDVEKLRSVNGFRFWENLPYEHAGEDVVAELRVMDRYGGCGLIPSGVYHQELPTTVPNRKIDAPNVVNIDIEGEI